MALYKSVYYYYYYHYHRTGRTWAAQCSSPFLRIEPVTGSLKSVTHGRLLFQLRNITALWPAPNYTAWRQLCVNNLPNYLEAERPAVKPATSESRVKRRDITPPGHTFHRTWGSGKWQTGSFVADLIKYPLSLSAILRCGNSVCRLIATIVEFHLSSTIEI